MYGSGRNSEKSARFYSSRLSPVIENSPVNHQVSHPNKTKSKSIFGCCKGSKDGVSVSSIVSTTTNQQHQQPRSPSPFALQVVELEREVVRQKELRTMYRKRMERTQDYLKYCLQIAQDNGFLGLISKNYQEHQLYPNLDVSVKLSPNQHSSNLEDIINQAKTNGWYIENHEIELQEKIGKGSTSEIYRAVWRGLDVAVKCINPSFFNSNENGIAYFAQELDTLSKQRHRFVLQLMGACLGPPNNAWVVTELLGLTLKDWLHGPGSRKQARSVPLQPIQIRISIALEIAQAMQYLHEQRPKVLHRDLKPSNIFLDDADHVRVADFGHARFLTDDEMALTGETGTYVYMAPEVIRCEPYNEKCDVYSFGIILNELVTGNHPYIETNYGPAKIAMGVAEGELRPRLAAEENGQLGLGEVVSLICNAWDRDASARPSFATITSRLRNIQQTILQMSDVIIS